MITGISGFGFFVQKWPFRDSELFSTKWVAETPIFIVFFWVRAFLAKLSKKGNFGNPPKKKENFD